MGSARPQNEKSMKKSSTEFAFTAQSSCTQDSAQQDLIRYDIGAYRDSSPLVASWWWISLRLHLAFPLGQESAGKCKGVHQLMPSRARLWGSAHYTCWRYWSQYQRSFLFSEENRNDHADHRILSERLLTAPYIMSCYRRYCNFTTAAMPKQKRSTATMRPLSKTTLSSCFRKNL